MFRTETARCEYIFDWESTAACPLQDEEAQDNCKVVDQYGNEFDLNPLSTLQYGTKDRTDKNFFTLSICGAASCGNLTDAAVCMTPKSDQFNHMAIGLVSKDLDIANGDVSITYESKVPCPNTPGFTRSVIISLICDDEATPGIVVADC